MRGNWSFVMQLSLGLIGHEGQGPLWPTTATAQRGENVGFYSEMKKGYSE